MSTTFNEDSRFKVPALLHLSRLGYDYLSLKHAQWDTRTNIFPAIFEAALLRINRAFEKRKQSGLCENRELTQLRDWLLPLLMNGQVRVA